MTNPLVDIEAAGGVCPTRLEKSIGLLVQPAPDRGVYLVSGGAEPHWVNLTDPTSPRCDCGDHLRRELVCCHILAALYFEGDERVISAVRRLVLMLREEITSLERVSRHFRVRLTSALKREIEEATGRTYSQIRYTKSPLTELPSVTVFAVDPGKDTGEVLGTINAPRRAPRFSAEPQIAGSASSPWGTSSDPSDPGYPPLNLIPSVTNRFSRYPCRTKQP